jgi:hypothetical protein
MRSAIAIARIMTCAAVAALVVDVRAQDAHPRRGLSPLPDAQGRERDVRSTVSIGPDSSPITDVTARWSGGSRHDQMYFDQTPDGTVWVRGRTYKASFGADGATYIPYFGSSAPQNYPVHMTIESVRAGEQALAFDGQARAERVQNHVSYDRGSVIEQYDVALDSVEQTFVVASAPAPGDLVIRLALESELVGCEKEGGLELSNELGAVRIGRADVLDAAGSRLESATTLGAGAIEVRVPATALASAQWPVTIDPVVSTFTINGAATDDFNARDAYDADSNRWGVTYEETYSATDHDIYAQLLDGSGTTLFSGAVDFTTVYWGNPDIANNRAAGQFLVVAEFGSSASGQTMIWGRQFDAVSLTMGPQFPISPNDRPGQKFSPHVGGDPFPTGPSFYCVVWQRYDSPSFFSDVNGILVQTVPAALTTTSLALGGNLAGDALHPNVSRGDGQAGNWIVVFEHAGPAFWEVWGTQVDFAGSITIPPSPIDMTASFDSPFPAVSSPLEDDGQSGSHYMVVYNKYFSSTDHDIIGTLITNQPAGIVALDTEDLSVVFENPWNGLEQDSPSVDSDGRHFAVVYQENVGGTMNLNLSDYVMSGNSIISAEVHKLLTSGANPHIASRRGAGGPASRYLAVGESGTVRDVVGGFYDSVSGGPITSYCLGDGTGHACPCGNTGAPGHGCRNSANAFGGQLTTTGGASTVADTLTLVTNFEPSTSSTVFIQGTGMVNGGSGAIFGDGLRCLSGTIKRLGSKISIAGSAHYPAAGDLTISVRGNVPASGGTFFYQAWYRNFGGPCGTGINMTNGLKIVWTL